LKFAIKIILVLSVLCVLAQDFNFVKFFLFLENEFLKDLFVLAY
jgi:hypothetical protein